MALADVIPIDNAVQAFVRNFHATNDPTTPITDATFVFSIYDTDGNAISGGDTISMSHDAAGNYFGNATPTVVEKSRYRVVITCSNYVAKWTRWFIARTRPFDM